MHRLYQTRPQSPLLVVPKTKNKNPANIINPKTAKLMREVSTIPCSNPSNAILQADEAKRAKNAADDDDDDEYDEPYFSEEEEDDEEEDGSASMVGLPAGLRVALDGEKRRLARSGRVN